ncbi:MAG: PLP-dependent aminotransferase family protein [Bauldia sp.]|uniref:aminotransferase-like domain-containing protein n=1 Tax=Bauldia sp. TaxID=2575872 RepID=UPI001D53F7A4|nr:PLP-dependent aminotransferase family protein [Bauldia sp.]MCB1497837.1 PLP-dependent aminotransferase family protein [Bauldia sp.]
MLTWLPDIDRGYGDAYVILADAIEGAIRSGRLKAGERLPTHRALARQLGVATSTVTRGYAEATGRGLLESTVGRGTFVRSATNGNSAGGAETRPLERMYVSSVPEADVIDLSLNHPLKQGAGQALGESLSAMIGETDLDELSLYHPPHGRADHRAAGADWLNFLGVEADPEDVMVVAGGQTGLLSTLLAFARRGDVVVTESLTWPGALAIAQSVGIRLESVDLDDEGLDPDRFEEACKRLGPRLLYTMPTLQNPTTATASTGRRKDIARIAREHGVLIVEDDAYGFILQPRVSSYWEIAPDISIYLTSLSKPIAPAMRIGYLAARAQHRRRLLGTLRATTVMPSPLLSELAARMIRSGEGAKRANFQADAAFRRQRLADRILGPASGVSASLHRWVPLPPGIRTSDFVASALSQGVAVTPGDVFCVRPGDDPGAVRVCVCAEPDERRLERALNTLARLAEADRSAALPVV